jgi:hypothetical protein
MDLIDMRTRPDANDNGKTYRWILQLKDHFSKFCWAKPLEHKQADEVYNCTREIFFLFGAPHILQSDNGREFVNQLINGLERDFPGYGTLSFSYNFNSQYLFIFSKIIFYFATYYLLIIIKKIHYI